MIKINLIKSVSRILAISLVLLFLSFTGKSANLTFGNSGGFACPNSGFSSYNGSVSNIGNGAYYYLLNRSGDFTSENLTIYFNNIVRVPGMYNQFIIPTGGCSLGIDGWAPASAAPGQYETITIKLYNSSNALIGECSYQITIDGQDIEGVNIMCPNTTQTYSISSYSTLNGGTYLWQATGGYLFNTKGGLVSSITTTNTSMTVKAPSTSASGTITVSNNTGNLCQNITKDIKNYLDVPFWVEAHPGMQELSSDLWRVFSFDGSLNYYWSFEKISGLYPNTISLSQNGVFCNIFAPYHSRGDYIISVYSYNSCLNSPVLQYNLHVSGYMEDIASGLDIINNDNKFKLYPNPASDYLTINLSLNVESMYNIKLINVYGEQVYSYDTKLNLGENTINIDTRKILNGIYNVIIDNGTNIKMEKVIITH